MKHYTSSGRYYGVAQACRHADAQAAYPRAVSQAQYFAPPLGIGFTRIASQPERRAVELGLNNGYHVYPNIPMARIFIYLAAVMDRVSRKLLAWRVAITLDAECCVAAMGAAVSCYGRPQIVNTDHDASSPVRPSPSC